MTVEIKQKKARHCYRCGRKCEYVQYLDHYDTETGQPVMYTHEFCPVFFVLRSLTSHVDEKYDEKGNILVSYGY